MGPLQIVEYNGWGGLESKGLGTPALNTLISQTKVQFNKLHNEATIYYSYSTALVCLPGKITNQTIQRYSFQPDLTSTTPPSSLSVSFSRCLFKFKSVISCSYCSNLSSFRWSVITCTVGYFSGQRNVNGTTGEIRTNKWGEEHPFALHLCQKSCQSHAGTETVLSLILLTWHQLSHISCPGVLISTMLSGSGPVLFSPDCSDRACPGLQ